MISFEPPLNSANKESIGAAAKSVRGDFDREQKYPRLPRHLITEWSQSHKLTLLQRISINHLKSARSVHLRSDYMPVGRHPKLDHCGSRKTKFRDGSQGVWWLSGLPLWDTAC
jgi:hypothetical protein